MFDHKVTDDQNLCIDESEELNIGKERKIYKHAQLNKDKAWHLRGLAGQLNWVTDLYETRYSL